mgnify:CR=1 FL=1
MLALSILALLAGPLLFRLFQGSRESNAALDGFVRISLAGLLLVHILPQSLGLFGWPAAGIFLAGAVLPMLAHGLFRTQGPRALNWEVSLGLAGLALHTFLDGVALHPFEGSPEGDSLAFAVVLHRLPVGLAVWWLVRPRVKAAVAVFALIVLSTLLGESLGGSFLGESARWMSAFQAFMAGALLHVVVGHSFQLSQALTRKSEKIASGLGGLLAIVLLLVASHESGSAGRAFLQLAGESAPALLAASVTVALAKAFLPIQLVNFFRGGGRFSQALRGTVAGLPVPICSCGVIPMYRGLIEAGTPRSAAIAFLIASPEIGWASMLLSLSLLGGPMTVLRVAGAALLALVRVGEESKLREEVLERLRQWRFERLELWQHQTALRIASIITLRLGTRDAEISRAVVYDGKGIHRTIVAARLRSRRAGRREARRDDTITPLSEVPSGSAEKEPQ